MSGTEPDGIAPDRTRPDTGPATGLRRLRPPTATPAAVAVTVVVALLLLVLAGIAIRDAVIKWSWVDGDEWIAAASRWVADLSWQVWMWPVAVVLVIVGLLLVWTAVAPRTRTHVAVVGEPGAAGRDSANSLAPHVPVDGYRPSTWTRRVDVARRASAVARDLPGAHSATTTVSRRRVTVKVIADPRGSATTDLEATVRHTVSDAVRPAIGDRPLRVRVTVPTSATTDAQTPPTPTERPDLPTRPADDTAAGPDLTKEAAR